MSAVEVIEHLLGRRGSPLDDVRCDLPGAPTVAEEIAKLLLRVC